MDLSPHGASHYWFKEREESFSRQQEPWSTQKESASLLERATSKCFTFLSSAAGLLSCLSHLLTKLAALHRKKLEGLWLRLQIMQMAREREWKRETAARGLSISLRFYPKKARPIPHALGLRFMTQQLCFLRNKTSPVTSFYPAALATNIRLFSTSTAEEPATLWIQDETHCIDLSELHALPGCSLNTSSLLSVVLVLVSASSFSFFSPFFTANNQTPSSPIISHIENTTTYSSKLHFTLSSNSQEALTFWSPGP